jgi:hypothetical protein
VQRRRIADPGQLRCDRGDRLGAQRRRGGMIEIRTGRDQAPMIMLMIMLVITACAA